MFVKKLAFGMLLSSSLVFVGCGDDDGHGADTGTADTGGMDSTTGDDTGTPMPLPGECADGECIFVTNAVSIPDVAVMGGVEIVNGFNIDDRVSDETDVEACQVPDFTAPDGRDGIDNQLASLKPTLDSFIEGGLDATIESSLADGSLILLMELTGAESTDDDSVTLNLYLGQTVDGGPPMLDGGVIAPGQTFNIDPTGGDPAATVPASTVGGSLSAGPIDLPLAFPLDETTTLTLNIRNASVSADIGTGSLSNGIIGGELIIEELITTVMAIGGDLPIDVIMGTLESVADLSPDGEGVCQSLSVGIEFGAVDAIKGVLGT